MIKFNKSELKKLVTEHFPEPDFRILDISGRERGSNGYPVVIENNKKEKLFLKIVKKDIKNKEDIDFEIKTLKELSKIDNPNVVKLNRPIDAGDGYFILEFEFIKGETLEKIIERKKKARDCFSNDEIYKFAKDILNALKSINALNKVHQDIKPRNIKYDGEKYILLDLGIARFKEPIVNKRCKAVYKYSSPEQLLSYLGIQPRPAISIQSDLFSLGILMYEVATSHYPLGSGDYCRIINAVIEASPKAVNRSLDNNLENIILKLLKKRVSERFPDLDELAESLKKKSFIIRRPKFQSSIFYLHSHPSTTKFPNFLDYRKRAVRAAAPDGIIFSTSFFPQNEKRSGSLLAQGYKFLIDPETVFLPFKSKSYKNKLKDVKYNLKKTDYFSELITKGRLDWWIGEVVKHQLNKGGDFIITPTFLVNNSTDKNLILNFTSAQKTLELCQKRRIKKPVICSYYVTKNFISDNDSRDLLISQILALDGFYAIYLISESDVKLGREPKNSKPLLRGLRDFVEKVSSKYPVLLGYSGIEAIPLFGCGLSGVATNMYRTNFITEKLSDSLESSGGGKRAKLYYYVPGLLNFLELREIRTILKVLEKLEINKKIPPHEASQLLTAFKCNCPFCNHSKVFEADEGIVDRIDNWWESDLDNHYLFHIIQESKKIWSVDQIKAKKYIQYKIKVAKENYDIISKRFSAVKLKKASRGEFLKAWNEVFN